MSAAKGRKLLGSAARIRCFDTASQRRRRLLLLAGEEKRKGREKGKGKGSSVELARMRTCSVLVKCRSRSRGMMAARVDLEGKREFGSLDSSGCDERTREGADGDDRSMTLW